MNRRHLSAAALLGPALALLATACGSSGHPAASGGTGTSTATATATARTTATGSSAAGTTTPAGSGSTTGPARPSAPSGPAAGTGGASGATSGNGGTGGGGVTRKPCYIPAGYDRFLQFHSAANAQGGTLIRVTVVTCAVNTTDDEDVAYTPVRAESLLVPADAHVSVLSGTSPHSVSGSWLVGHPLQNSPYFYARLDSRNRVAALQEIYHP